MSYKLNQKDPSRRQKIKNRRGKLNIPFVEDRLYKDKYGVTRFKGIKGSPHPMVTNLGTPMKISNRNAMLKKFHTMIANGAKLEEEFQKYMVNAILAGVASKKWLLDYHPTKAGT